MCDEAELGQGLDPARGVALNAKRFIVSGGTPVMFAPLDHEEDSAENLVTDGDDGTFVATPHSEALELRLEHGGSATGGMSELTEQTANVEIRFIEFYDPPPEISSDRATHRIRHHAVRKTRRVLRTTRTVLRE